MPTLALAEKDPLEVITITFTFSGLAGGETISTATVAATAHQGTDAAPSAILSGGPQISGTSVLHQVIGGVSGVVYKLRCKITTSAGRTLVIGALLPVRTF